MNRNSKKHNASSDGAARQAAIVPRRTNAHRHQTFKPQCVPARWIPKYGVGSKYKTCHEVCQRPTGAQDNAGIRTSTRHDVQEGCAHHEFFGSHCSRPTRVFVAPRFLRPVGCRRYGRVEQAPLLTTQAFPRKTFFLPCTGVRRTSSTRCAESPNQGSPS